jgi:hypothetical protein
MVAAFVASYTQTDALPTDFERFLTKFLQSDARSLKRML